MMAISGGTKMWNQNWYITLQTTNRGQSGDGYITIETTNRGQSGDGYITLQTTNKSDRPEVTEILDAGSNGYMFESRFSQ